MALLTLFLFAQFMEGRRNMLLDDVVGIVEDAADDTGEWIEDAADDTSEWVEDAEEDTIDWVVEAWDDFLCALSDQGDEYLYEILKNKGMDIDEQLKKVPNVWYVLGLRDNLSHNEWANRIMLVMGDHLIEGPLCENGNTYLEDYLDNVLCIVEGIDQLHPRQADQLCALYCEFQGQDLVSLNSCTCNSAYGTADGGCGITTSQRAMANNFPTSGESLPPSLSPTSVLCCPSSNELCDVDKLPRNQESGESGLSCPDAWEKFQSAVRNFAQCPGILASFCPVTCNACPAVPSSKPTHNPLILKDLIRLAVNMIGFEESDKDTICSSVTNAVYGTIADCGDFNKDSSRRLGIATLDMDINVADKFETFEVIESNDFISLLEDIPANIAVLDVLIKNKYTLLFRQTISSKLWTKDLLELNPDDPNNDNYAILNRMEEFRSADDRFYFKLSWPEADEVTMEWSQTSNPLTEEIRGYEAIHVDYTGQYWGGLEPSTSPSALMDGSVGHRYWFYAVGACRKWHYGIPAYAKSDDDYTYPQNRVELYVQKKN